MSFHPRLSSRLQPIRVLIVALPIHAVTLPRMAAASVDPGPLIRLGYRRTPLVVLPLRRALTLPAAIAESVHPGTLAYGSSFTISACPCPVTKHSGVRLLLSLERASMSSRVSSSWATAGWPPHCRQSIAVFVLIPRVGLDVVTL